MIFQHLSERCIKKLAGETGTFESPPLAEVLLRPSVVVVIIMIIIIIAAPINGRLTMCQALSRLYFS